MLEGKVLSAAPINDNEYNSDELYNINVPLPVAIEIVMNPEPLPVPESVHHVVYMPDTSRQFRRSSHYSSRFRPRSLRRLLYRREQRRLYPQSIENEEVIESRFYGIPLPSHTTRVYCAFSLMVAICFIPVIWK